MTTVIAQDWAIKLCCLIFLIRFRWIGMCRSLLLHAQRTKGKGRTQRSNERDILARLLLLLIFIYPSVMRYGLIMMMMMMGACNGIASPSGGVMMTAFVSFPRCIFSSYSHRVLDWINSNGVGGWRGDERLFNYQVRRAGGCFFFSFIIKGIERNRVLIFNNRKREITVLLYAI